jgi:serine/threonine protein kinase/Flp pilus assembly protein TadD
MNASQLDEEAIFQVARRIADPDARAAYLGQVCAADAAMRRRVERLLRVCEEEASFLAPAARAVTVDRPAPTEGPGESIGPYRLMETIGEGGMGVVYVAEQHQPVRRKVALKVIKPGMDSKAVIARFEAERQALALMDHPNIARVLDAGTTGQGRPYFVMELVRGIPITEYCDRERLSVPERLELFVLVCRAVQHAHQKGVIHRDLKPSNILVTLHDGVSVPKVIDFGIAKAVGQSLTEKTLYTGFLQLVGTPLYMSPEQADLSSLDVDTRSDIYSLGVLLYELLTGVTPFDPETLRRAALDELRRIMREEEPPRPSMRLTSLGAALTTVSAHRKADARRLDRAVRGELDWIVMKALEKDRNRRYETANAFAADVLRYITGQPVEACPPSAWYRFKKAARRNRVALTTAALVAVALGVGTAVSAWQAVRAKDAERRATAARRQAEEHLALGFQALEGQYERVADQWLGDVNWLPLPRPFLEQSLTFYERFADEDRPDPTVGRANRRVGEILIQLGRHRKSDRFLQQSESVWQALLVWDPSNVGYARDLAACYEARVHSLDWSKNLLLYERAIALREDVARRFPGNPLYSRELAKSHQLLGSWAAHFPREGIAEDHLNRAIKILDRLSDSNPGNPDVLCDLGVTLDNLAYLFQRSRRYEEAESLSLRSATILEKLVARYPTRPRYRLAAGWNYRSLGQILIERRRFIDAVPIAARGATLFEGLRADNPDAWSLPWEVADQLVVLAVASSSCGSRPEAEQAIDRLGRLDAPQIRSESLAEIAWHLTDADAPHLQGDLAYRCAARALELNPDSMLARHVLGLIHFHSGRWDHAIDTLTRATELAGNPAYPIDGFLLAMAFHHKGDAATARSWFDRSAAWMARPHEEIAIHRLSRWIHIDKNELMRYRDEAASLLGVGPSNPRTKSAAEPTRPP